MNICFLLLSPPSFPLTTPEASPQPACSPHSGALRALPSSPLGLALLFLPAPPVSHASHRLCRVTSRLPSLNNMTTSCLLRGHSVTPAPSLYGVPSCPLFFLCLCLPPPQADCPPRAASLVSLPPGIAMGGASLEVMHPSHTRGLWRWGKNRNATQRLRIKFLPPFCAGGRLVDGGGLGHSFPAKAEGGGEWELGALQPSASHSERLEHELMG